MKTYAYRKQAEIQDEFLDEGMDLVWARDIPDEKGSVFWYGGDIAYITDGKGALITLRANGDVRGAIYDGDTMEEIDSFVDKDNAGDRDDVGRYIKNDDELFDALEMHGTGYAIELEDHNWLEWFFDCGKGDGTGDIDTDVLEPQVGDSDDIFEELGNSAGWWCRHTCAEIHMAERKIVLP